MKDDGFKIEERDDPRTLSDKLIPDCEFVGEEPVVIPWLEYLGEFKALIDACGQVSYYYNMKNYLNAGSNKAKLIASAYQHDGLYYDDQLNEWRAKAKRSFAILSLQAAKLGYKMPKEKEFLNDLALYRDRREAYKDYLGTCFNNQKTLSPAELEAKYQKRLQKRYKKKTKK